MARLRGQDPELLQKPSLPDPNSFLGTFTAAEGQVNVYHLLMKPARNVYSDKNSNKNWQEPRAVRKPNQGFNRLLIFLSFFFTNSTHKTPDCRHQTIVISTHKIVKIVSGENIPLVWGIRLKLRNERQNPEKFKAQKSWNSWNSCPKIIIGWFRGQGKPTSLWTRPRTLDLLACIVQVSKHKYILAHQSLD